MTEKRRSDLGYRIALLLDGATSHSAHDWAAIIERLDDCESPIEQDLFVSLLFADWPCGRFPKEVQTVPFEIASLVPPKMGARLIISPQAKWEKYRFDFAIHVLVAPKPFFFVVECDGHDFHERTKEQAERDRSRDRACTLAGITVFRFTGREIHRDPDACAAEVVKLSRSLVERLQA